MMQQAAEAARILKTGKVLIDGRDAPIWTYKLRKMSRLASGSRSAIGYRRTARGRKQPRDQLGCFGLRLEKPATIGWRIESGRTP